MAANVKWIAAIKARRIASPDKEGLSYDGAGVG